jgi:hypothetical protein
VQSGDFVARVVAGFGDYSLIPFYHGFPKRYELGIRRLLPRPKAPAVVRLEITAR